MLCLRQEFGKGEIVAAVRREEKSRSLAVIASEATCQPKPLAKAEAIHASAP